MLNIYERLADYHVKNYFVFNTTNNTVDIFGPKVVEWHQKIIVLMDMLREASKQNIQDQYDILSIRIVGLDATNEAVRILMDNLSLCNKLLAEELGESSGWLDIKDGSLEKRHFLSIVIMPPKQTSKVEKIAKPISKGKPRFIQDVSDDKSSV